MQVIITKTLSLFFYKVWSLLDSVSFEGTTFEPFSYLFCPTEVSFFLLWVIEVSYEEVGWVF